MYPSQSQENNQQTVSRPEQELKQSDIAKALNISNQAVSSWEKGIATPALNPFQTQQLCSILNVTFDELVKGFNGEVEININ